MVDESGRSKPQLCTVLSTRIHDTEVIDTRTQKPHLFIVSQLSQTTNQTSDLLTFQPASQPSSSSSSSAAAAAAAAAHHQF